MVSLSRLGFTAQPLGVLLLGLVRSHPTFLKEGFPLAPVVTRRVAHERQVAVQEVLSMWLAMGL